MRRLIASPRRRCALAVMTLSAILAGCGGGGDDKPPPPPPPPPVITLSGSALYAERIALSWTTDEINARQAYAIMVDGSVRTTTTQKGYLFTALPDTRYCFVVVVGALPPLGPFVATGPSSNELCLTTPSLPPLASGWSVADAGFGHGAFPAIARRAPGSTAGLYACVACTPDNACPLESAVFGQLGSSGMLLPTFAYPGDACAVTNNASFFGDVDVLTRAGATVAYRQARPDNGMWFFTGATTVAADAAATMAVSMALDDSGRPQVLFGRGGQVYWARREESGLWSVPEVVGDGGVGWRSLAVASDGTVFALLAGVDTVVVRRRDAPGIWTTAYSAGGASAALFARGTGSIVAPASGGVRLAYGRPDGVGYVEWLGGATPWTESRVDAGTRTAAPALAVDLAGEPLIAYGDGQADLRLSRRVGGQWRTDVIDALGDLARQADIEVDGAGVVYILYSDDAGAARLATGR